MSARSRNVIDYLHNARRLDRAVKRNRAEIDRLKSHLKEVGESVQALHAVSYDGIGVQTSKVNRTEERIIKAVDVEREICSRIAELEQRNASMDADRIKVIEQINKLGGDPCYPDILFHVYVEQKDLQYVADQMGKSYYYCCHKHGEALMKFAEQYLDNNK